MDRINLSQNQFSDLLNLLNKVFYPLDNFVDKNKFEQIVKFQKINGKFFSYPIFFGISKKKYITIKEKSKIKLYFKKKEIAYIEKINFFKINKKYFGKMVYGKNFKLNPFYNKFENENYIFLSFNFRKIIWKNLKHKFFISPEKFKKKILTKKNSSLSSFHTRNVPHSAHQWIHNYLIKNFNSLLIQPLIGQYKSGEYKDEVIIKLNRLAIKSLNKGPVYVIPFFSYPRYAGPKEAALHAIVRKNYGCSHFWVGRDHGGYKNLFKIYESQKYCLNNQKKMGIKIVAESEPYYCVNCKKIKNICKNKKCSNKYIIKISGSEVRRMLLNNDIIPSYIMDKKISKKLDKNSLIN